MNAKCCQISTKDFIVKLTLPEWKEGVVKGSVRGKNNG